MEPGEGGSGTFATPRKVTDVADCDFYHVMDLPGVGRVGGSWDLRAGLEDYLSRLPLAGRRVLEIGAADGYLTVEMERRGAEVVALDLGPGDDYDCVPVAAPEVAASRERMRDLQRRRRNAFWLVHRLCGSSARLVHGHASALPPDLGPVDHCFVANLLQHLENPLRTLAEAARVARESVVVTEANWRTGVDPDQPTMTLLAADQRRLGADGWCFHWWQTTPGLVSDWLALFGFRTVGRYQHHQLFAESGAWVPHFTVVARREAGAADPGSAGPG